MPDQFEIYYAEKLWETIPAIYRHEDGLGNKPGTLRALVEIIATQAAVLRRSQDQLWDDQFIELCQEWAVPYIGDLVATRMLSALNQRGRRIDVAKTIYYRRRKGTPRILEELISDISGWEGKMVEQFKELGRTRHGLDSRPIKSAGRFSGTQPGGWADIRNVRMAELATGPFDEYFFTPDTRKHRGLTGRYHLSKLAFYLYRLKVYAVNEVTPFADTGGTRFSFDPSGRMIPLFSKRNRPNDWEQWHSAFEWELPAPIPCRLLAHAEYIISEETVQAMVGSGLSNTAANELRLLIGLRFRQESFLLNHLASMANQAELLLPAHVTQLLALTLVPDCGKQVLLPDSRTVTTNPLETSSIEVGGYNPGRHLISVENIAAANIRTGSVNTNRPLAIDAENGLFRFQTVANIPPSLFVSYHYGFSGNVGAGTYARPWADDLTPTQLKLGGGAMLVADLPANGICQINDSKTYGPVANKTSIINLTLQAASQQRPYLRLDQNWILNTGAQLNSKLVLDGLWVGATGNTPASLILRGNWEKVTLQNCSLDAGGDTNIRGETLHPITLLIDGFVEQLCIENCLMGPIVVSAAGRIEQICIEDSVVQSVQSSQKALDVGMGELHLEKVTVLGEVLAHRLMASEVIITQNAQVVDTQAGCFRFSAAPAISRLPHPYESYLFQEDCRHWFTSNRFGNPGYAQLSNSAPEAVYRGGENGAEMGAFNSLVNAIKFDGLRTKIDEYMPFGLIPIFIPKT